MSSSSASSQVDDEVATEAVLLRAQRLLAGRGKSSADTISNPHSRASSTSNATSGQSLPRPRTQQHTLGRTAAWSHTSRDAERVSQASLDEYVQQRVLQELKRMRNTSQWTQDNADNSQDLSVDENLHHRALHSHGSELSDTDDTEFDDDRSSLGASSHREGSSKEYRIARGHTSGLLQDGYPKVHRGHERQATNHRSNQDLSSTRHSQHPVQTRLQQAAPEAFQHEVHEELLQISRLLQYRSDSLDTREADIEKKEAEIAVQKVFAEQRIQELERELRSEAEREVTRRSETFEREHTSSLHQQVDALSKNTKRQHAAFLDVRAANTQLKEQVAELEKAKLQLTEQLSQANGRIRNLKRDADLQKRKPGPLPASSSSAPTNHRSELRGSSVDEGSKPQLTRSDADDRAPSALAASSIGSKPLNSSVLNAVLELMGLLMEEMNSRIKDSNIGGASSSTPSAEATSKCLKSLPALSELLGQLSSTPNVTQAHFLQFVRWCIQMVCQSDQQGLVKSSLRRIGDEIYRSGSTDAYKLSKDKSMFRSSDPTVRMLSALIVLDTSTQVDVVVHAFDVLRSDLQSREGKQLFMQFKGFATILPCFIARSKPQLMHATDICLMLTMDSAVEEDFLAELCCDAWFRAMTVLWNTSRTSPAQADTVLLEKLSVVLQKLSKLKIAKPMLEKYNFVYMLKEALSTYASTCAFLALNLRSVLLNIDAASSSQSHA